MSSKNKKNGMKMPKQRNAYYLDALFHTGAGDHGDKKKYKRIKKYKKDWMKED